MAEAFNDFSSVRKGTDIYNSIPFQIFIS
jgi:hypothetical protein